jgi:hypothetical protein
MRAWPTTVDELIREQGELAHATPPPWQPEAEFAIGGASFASFEGRPGPARRAIPAGRARRFAAATELSPQQSPKAQRRCLRTGVARAP